MTGMTNSECLMKKTLIYLMGALAIVSCAKEIDAPVEANKEQEPEIQKQTYTLIASIPTKTTLDGAVFNWAAGETIAVADETTTSKEFEISADADERANGIFTYAGALTGSLRYAVSPADNVTIPSASGSNVTIELPSNYSYVEGRTNAVMVSTAPVLSSGTYTAHFAHTMALIKVAYSKVPVGTKYFKLTMDQNISGVSVTKDASSTVVINTDDVDAGASPKKYVTVTLPTAVSTKNQAYTFYVPVPVGTYGSFKAQLFNESDVVLNEKNKAFSVGNELELAKADIFATPTIDADVDIIDRAFTGKTGSYAAWSGKSGSSSTAVYAGYSMQYTSNGSDAIQLKSSDNIAGIVTTTTGGLAKKIVLKWNSGTLDARKIDVYGKETAYSAASDLYGANKGTLLGSIDNSKSETTLTISGNYPHIGLRSNSGAIYLDQILVTWAVDSRPTLANPTISPNGGSILTTETVSISATAGATIYYTTDGSAPTRSSLVYSAPIAVTGDFTLKAFAVKDGSKDSGVAEAVFTVPVCDAPEFTPDGSTKIDSGDDVTMTCMAGGTIHYTTDGSAPDPTDAGVASGTKVENITSQTTIRAVVTKPGYLVSSETSATYMINGSLVVLSNPTGVSIFALSSSSITAKWNEVANASSYTWVISTATTEGAITNENTLASNEDGGAAASASEGVYSVTRSGSFAAGTRYYLYVKAIGDGVSYSNSATVVANKRWNSYTLTIAGTDLTKGSGSGYAAYNGSGHSVDAVAANMDTFTVEFTTSQVMPNNTTNLQFQGSAGKLYNTTDLQNITSGPTTTIASGTNDANQKYVGSTEDPDSAGSGGFFRVARSSSGVAYLSSIVVVFTATDSI